MDLREAFSWEWKEHKNGHWVWIWSFILEIRVAKSLKFNKGSEVNRLVCDSKCVTWKYSHF